MFGEPNDVEGECNACLFIADNYGDNSATIRCQLPLNHEGQHRETFERHGGPVTIAWTVDERRRCDHGCGQWEHQHGREDITCPKDAEDHEYSECAFCHPKREAKICGLSVTRRDPPVICRQHRLHCAFTLALMARRKPPVAVFNPRLQGHQVLSELSQTPPPPLSFPSQPAAIHAPGLPI